MNDVRNLLISIFRENENYLSGLLAHYFPNLNLIPKKDFLESLINYYTLAEQIKPDFIVDEFNPLTAEMNVSNKDFRIKNVKISGVRGIPDSSADNIHFGIDFYEENLINNAIILANNGTGKSSIFSALEMIYAQEISEKKLRVKNYENLSDADFQAYLRRYPYKQEPFCEISTPSGDYNLKAPVFSNLDEMRRFNPSNHFISDFDLYHYGQKEFNGASNNRNSFHSLIADSLGLGDFILFQSILRETAFYQRRSEGKNLRHLEGQLLDSEKNIILYKEQIDTKEQELRQRKEKQQSEDNNIIKKRISQFNDLLAKKMGFSVTENDFSSSVERFSKLYDRSLTNKSDTKGNNERNFLYLGLELLEMRSDCPFCEDSLRTKTEIKDKAENRIAILDASLKLEEELRSAYKSTLDILIKFFNDCFDFYDKVDKERNDIVGISELSNLFKETEILYVKMSLFINDRELLDYIRDLSSIPFPDSKNFEALYNLIHNDIVSSYVNLMQDMVSHLDYRSNLLNEKLQYNLDLIKNTDGLVSNEQQIVLITDDLNRIKNQIDAITKQISNLNLQKEIAEKELLLVGRIQNDLKGLLFIVDSKINKLVNEAFIPVQDSVETILRQYLREENIIFNISRQEEQIELDGQQISNFTIVANIKCIDKETEEVVSITPDIYFNTFRYKLFCLMVSLSLALATRKKYNVNLPLVIDDIFFASDFISKNSFAEFIQKVIKLFHKHTPSLPLQIIMFTHDDLIFRSAIDAVQTYTASENDQALCFENKLNLQDKTIIGRFFHPSDKDSSPAIFAEDKKYWNLLYRIPKRINALN